MREFDRQSAAEIGGLCVVMGREVQARQIESPDDCSDGERATSFVQVKNPIQRYAYNQIGAIQAGVLPMQASGQRAVDTRQSCRKNLR